MGSDSQSRIGSVGKMTTWSKPRPFDSPMLTTAFAGIIVADFYIVRRVFDNDLATEVANAEAVNWSGVATLVIAVVIRTTSFRGCSRSRASRLWRCA